MLLALLLAVVEPGNGIDIPPADDPVGRIIATFVMIAVPVSAVITAKITAKKSPTNGPTPLIPGTSPAASPTPRLDLGEQYLAQYVGLLNDRVQALEDENKEQDKRFIDLLEKNAVTKAELAVALAQLVAMKTDNAELRDEVHELRGQLRGRRDV